MSDAMLSNRQSGRVKRAAALTRKKDRRAQGRFLVEGPQAVREALVHAPHLIEIVYATDESQSWQLEIDRLADDAGVELVRATPEVVAAMTETVTPQGVVAIVEDCRVALADACAGAQLVAVLHEVRDPGNAGAVLRAADAAGADAVVFAGDSVDPLHPKVVRSTTGSLFHLPVASADTLEDAISAVREAGLAVVAADVDGAELAAAREAQDLGGATAWVFGNEARGLSAEALAQMDRSVRLPIYGRAESLNLATAASVLLYESAFAQRSR